MALELGAAPWGTDQRHWCSCHEVHTGRSGVGVRDTSEEGRGTHPSWHPNLGHPTAQILKSAVAEGRGTGLGAGSRPAVLGDRGVLAVPPALPSESTGGQHGGAPGALLCKVGLPRAGEGGAGPCPAQRRGSCWVAGDLPSCTGWPQAPACLGNAWPLWGWRAGLSFLPDARGRAGGSG